MRIIADAKLFFAKECFAGFGELTLVPGREIVRDSIGSADALLVRSITEITAELLEGSSVKFIGTATSGTDHVDVGYLLDRGIQFADAKGCNANAVVDYCIAGLGYYQMIREIDVRDSKVGIVGYGHVGSVFARRLAALGIDTVICDPPLQSVATERDSRDLFKSLQEIARCQVVSLHVPLTTTADSPTQNLIEADFLSALPEQALLMNTCRGSVVNEQDLLKLLDQRQDLTCIVDVWKNEPQIDAALAGSVAIATPHIAGYSVEAKCSATFQLLESFCDYFELAPTTLPEANLINKEAIADSCLIENDAWATLLKCLPIEQISTEFKSSIAQVSRDKAFDEFRSKLMARREFRSLRTAASRFSEQQRKILVAQGISLA